MNRLNRRDYLRMVLGTSAATIAGCHSSNLPPRGEWLSPHFVAGHRLRDRGFDRNVGPVRQESAKVVIVGGGIAGLSAAWQLARRGIEDFVVLEMESAPGGTSLSGNNPQPSTHAGEANTKFRYPWGAHYVPVPMASNASLIDLLTEMKAITARREDGSPIPTESALCRDPQERIFVEGSWHEGLYPRAIANDKDLQQLAHFRQQVDRWVEHRGPAGERAFAIPSSQSSSDQPTLGLDQVSMGQWMQDQRLDSPPLRWLVDHACRDDYGANANLVSAWAGLFYFASRRSKAGGDSQEYLTWPEGNGRIVEFLADRAQQRLRLSHMAIEVTQRSQSAQVLVRDLAKEQTMAYQAERVIFASPQFLTPHLIKDLPASRTTAAQSFRYGSWVVANLHLSDRPADVGFPACWDNVIYGSRSLGYVSATHQMGVDHGPTVLTWYYPLSCVDTSMSRQQLLSLDWDHWADIALADIQVAHPEIRRLVERIDVMRWGHAMVIPYVGFIDGADRRMACQPIGRIHFAGTDLSGIALMEEAFDHGLRAANEAATAMGGAAT